MENSSTGTHGRFTLIELLLVIGIVAILGAIVLVIMSPNDQLKDAYNIQRRQDIGGILNAVYKYGIDNKGNLPALPSTATEICRSQPDSDCKGLVDLSMLRGKYLSTIPADPEEATKHSTKYTIHRDPSNAVVTVSAPQAQNEVISVSQ